MRKGSWLRWWLASGLAALLFAIGGNGSGRAQGGPVWIGFSAASQPAAVQPVWTPEQSAAAQTGGPQWVDVTVRVPGVWAEQVAPDQTQVRLEGQAGRAARSGGPDLPVLRWEVEAPPDVPVTLQVLDVEVRQQSLAALGLPPDLPTVQPDACKCDDPSITAPEGAPQREEPPVLALVGDYVQRGRRVLVVEARPVGYDPASASLLVRGTLRGRLMFGGSRAERTAAYQQAAARGGRYAGAADGLELAYRLAPDNAFTLQAASGPSGYLILAPDAFAPALAPFVQLKRAEGYAVRLAVLSQVGHTPEAIRDYVQKAYWNDSSPPAYLLLVGDVDNGPNSLPAWPARASSTVTDLYYATLDGPDWTPDVQVGRWPVRTETDLRALVARSLQFARRDGGELWLQGASFLATCDSTYHLLVEGTHNAVIDAYTRQAGFWGRFPADPQPGGDRLYCLGTGASPGDVHAALDAGRALVVYSGHGTRTSWELDLFASGLGSVGGSGASPIVTSFACQTGDFSDETSLGEAWLQTGHALAFVGAADNTFWESDDVLQRGMFQSLFAGGEVTLGAALQSGLLEVAAYSPGLSQYYDEVYNLLGDPSLKPFAPPNTAGQVSLSAAPAQGGICANGVSEARLSAAYQPFDAPAPALGLDLTLQGLPPGVTASFAANPLTAPGQTVMTLRASPAAPPGVYALTVTGGAAGQAAFDLKVANQVPAAPDLLSPLDGARDLPTRPELVWSPVEGASSYTLQIAADASFNQVLLEAHGLSEARYTPDLELGYGLRYFWRVQAENACGHSANAPVMSAARAAGTPASFIVQTAPLTCPVGSAPYTVFHEDFDSGSAPGWTGGGWALSQALTDLPARGAALNAALGGPQRWAFAASAPLQPGAQSLLSPPFVLPDGGSPALTFWHARALERSGGMCYDAGLLEISVDGGASWQDLGGQLLTDGYNGTGGGAGNPLAGQASWCGASNGGRVNVDLSPYVGQSVRLRFRLGTDSSGALSGGLAWALDSLAVQACQAKPEFALGVDAPQHHIQAPPGQEAVFPLDVTNLGNVMDELQVQVSGGSWPARVVMPGVLEASQTVPLAVVVQVPATAQIGESEVMQVSISSLHNPAAQSVIALQTEASRYPVYMPLVQARR